MLSLTNEGDVQSCFDGNSNQIGVGPCKQGKQTCDSTGNWGACVGQVLPYTGEPNATHICDGTNWWCNPAGVELSTKCPCVAGQKASCFDGPGTVGYGSCKAGTRTCDSTGHWGSCVGQVVGYTGAADAAHPCNGTNWWCDPGDMRIHCPQCQSPQTLPCGDAKTCNASAVQSCNANGTWGSCSPSPASTCRSGDSYACTTCSSLGPFQSGSRNCSGQCDFNGSGSRCNPAVGAEWIGKGTDFLHQIGKAYNDGWLVNYWATGTPFAQYGPGGSPYAALPAGSYTATFKLQLLNMSSNGFVSLYLDVNSNSLGGALASSGLKGISSATPTEFSLDFTITPDCLGDVEFRVKIDLINGYSAGGAADYGLLISPTTVRRR